MWYFCLPAATHIWWMSAEKQSRVQLGLEYHHEWRFLPLPPHFSVLKWLCRAVPPFLLLPMHRILHMDSFLKYQVKLSPKITNYLSFPLKLEIFKLLRAKEGGTRHSSASGIGTAGAWMIEMSKAFWANKLTRCCFASFIIMKCKHHSMVCSFSKVTTKNPVIFLKIQEL